MPLFSKEKEQDNTGKYLGAAYFGGSALTADVGARAVRDYLGQSADELMDKRTQLLDADMRKRLVDTILDKELRTLPVVIDPSLAPKSAVFSQVTDSFVPDRETAMKAFESGGVMQAGGEKLPVSQFVNRARKAGGYVGLGANAQNVGALAHELGHATLLSGGYRGSGLHRLLYNLGTSAISHSPLVATGAALATMSMDSDNNLKWAVPAAILATQAPVLFEEAIATRKALAALEKLHGTSVVVTQPTVSPVGATATRKALAAVEKLPETNVVDDAAKATVSYLNKETLDTARSMLRRSFGTYGAGAAGLLAAPLMAMKARSIIDSLRDE